MTRPTASPRYRALALRFATLVIMRARAAAHGGKLTPAEEAELEQVSAEMADIEMTLAVTKSSS